MERDLATRDWRIIRMINTNNRFRFVRNYKFKSLFVKSMLLIMGLVFIPFGSMSYIMYHQLSSTLNSEISKLSVNSLTRTREAVEHILVQSDRLAAKISLLPQAEAFILSKSKEGMGGNIEMLNKSIVMFTDVFPYIDSIYVYSESSGIILSNKELNPLDSSLDSSWYKEFKNRPTNEPWIMARKRGDRYPYFLTILRPFYRYSDEKLGTVIVNINIEELGKQIGQVGLPEQERLFVVDQEGQILYSQDYSQIMTNRKDFRIIEDIRQEGTEIIKFQGVRYVISTVKSEKQPWLYISVVPLEKYGDEMERVNRILFVFYSIGLLVMLIIAFVISINTYEPLKVIMSLMENPREWLNQPKNQRLKASEATNELNYIMKNISVSYDSRQELEAELKKRIGILNKAKTYALQTQINPHFLFNTLETINWIAIRLLKGRNDISMLITELSKLLRISLESEQQLVSLQDEICNAETYIEIIKIRYSNRISFSWEVDDGVLDRMVPKLSLQPIIENAVQHGMKANQAGVIRITAKPIQGELVIEVRDEGVGMEQDKVSQLNEELRVVSEELTGKHIGLKNVNQRIRLIFGHTYGLRVSSVRNKGTVVTIHIPAIEQ